MSGRDKRNNYNRVAGIYDRLAGIIFGSAISRSQFSLLRYPLPGPRVLIAGGGTGALLEELGKTEAIPLQITFVELSERMLHKAQKRNAGIHEVRFICGAAEQLNTGHSFDVIITPFLFDNFTPGKAREVFSHLDNMLAPGGTWLFTDFCIYPDSPWWHSLLLRLMYCFFKILAAVEANHLPDTGSLFATGYACEKELFFYRNFIRSALYRKY